jgi:hypothetical protein
LLTGTRHTCFFCCSPPTTCGRPIGCIAQQSGAAPLPSLWVRSSSASYSQLLRGTPLCNGSRLGACSRDGKSIRTTTRKAG